MIDYKFVFETRDDAYEALRAMRTILNREGLVTVADLATIVGYTPNYTDKDYCWVALPRIEILRDEHGYMLDLPKPMIITARLRDDERVKGENKMGKLMTNPVNMAMRCSGNPEVTMSIAGENFPAKIVGVSCNSSEPFDSTTTLTVEIGENLSTKYIPYNSFYNNKNWRGTTSLPQITNVMFHPPATIVFWSDKTKTVVKCDERDVFDAEKGLAMAITKKMLGNNYEYYDVFEKWSSPYCVKEKSENTTPVRSFDSECLRFETEIVFGTWSECTTLIEYLRNKVARYGVTTVGDLYRYAGCNPPKNCEIYGWLLEDIDAMWFKKQTPGGYMLKIAAPKPIV